MWRAMPLVDPKVNPILDTQTYEVEFEDESMSTYSVNVIAESMHDQCDD